MKAARQKPRALPVRQALPVGQHLPLPPALSHVLNGVRARHLSVQLLEGAARLGIVLPVLWLLQAVADWVFVLPWNVRALFLAADVGILGYVAFRHLLKPLLQPLNAERAALLIERRMPQFRSELISAVQLASGGPGCVQGSVELVHRLLHRVANKIGHLDVPRRVVTTESLRRLAKILAGMIVVAGGLFAGFHPKSLVLLERILLSRDPLPTQTRVFPVTADLEVPEGGEALLSARAEGTLPQTGRLHLTYDDGRKETVSVAAGTEKPDVYSFPLPNIRQAFRYRFEIGDGVGSDHRVTVRVVPSVTATKFIQVYPAYTGLAETAMSPGSLTLLAGGRLLLEGTANQPLKFARLTLVGTNQTQEMEIVDAERKTFRADLPIPASGLEALTIQVGNEKGEESLPVTTRVEIKRDNPPVVSLLIPKTEKLTAQSDVTLPITYSLKDDYGIGRVTLRYEVFRPTTPDQEALPPEKGEIPLPLPPGGTTAPQPFRWDFGSVMPAFTIGSVVRFEIEAEDTNTLSGPGRATSRSRMVTIVSDEAKRLELLEAFGTTATKVEGLIKSQDSINKTTGSAVRSQPAP